MDEDFQAIAQKFSALSSVVRVPSLDPKYKIALLLSKQVNFCHELMKILIFCVFLSLFPQVV